MLGIVSRYVQDGTGVQKMAVTDKAELGAAQGQTSMDGIHERWPAPFRVSVKGVMESTGRSDVELIRGKANCTRPDIYLGEFRSETCTIRTCSITLRL